MTTNHGQIWYSGKVWHYKPRTTGMTYLYRTPAQMMADRKMKRYRPDLAFQEFKRGTIKAALEMLANVLIAKSNYYKADGATLENRKRKGKAESAFLKLALWYNGVLIKPEDQVDQIFVMPNYEKGIMDLLLEELRYS